MVARRAAWGRVRRLVGRVAAVVAAVVLAAFVMLQLPSVRGRLLTWGVGLADRALPGRLTAGAVSWPRWGTLELHDVLWLAPADPATSRVDTLAAVTRVAAAVDVRALMRHEAVVEHLDVDAASLDVPAITALFPAAAVDSTATATDKAAGGFLHEGGAPGVPAAAVLDLRLGVGRAVVAPDLALANLRLVGRADLRSPGPSLAVDTLAVAVQAKQGMAVDLASGRLIARWRHDVRTVQLDTLALVVADAGPEPLRARWRKAALEPLRLDGAGRLQVEPDLAGSLRLRVAAPVAALAGDAWPAVVPRSDLEPFACVLAVEGARREGRVQGEVALRIDPLPALDRAELQVSIDAPLADPVSGRMTLDALDLAVTGAEAHADGRWDDGNLEARLVVAAQTPLPLLAMVLPAAGDAEGRMQFEAGIRGSMEAPQVTLKLGGGGRWSDWRVGRVDLDAAATRDRAEVTLAGTGFARGDSLLLGNADLQASVAAPRGELRTAGSFDAAVDATFGRAFGVAAGRVKGAASVDPRAPLGARVRLDSLSLRAPGVVVAVAASGDTGAFDLAADLALTAPCPLVERFAAPLAGGDYGLVTSLRLEGALSDPRGALQASGTLDAGPGAVPEFSVEAAGDRRRFAVRARADGGLVWHGQALADSLDLAVDRSDSAADGYRWRTAAAVRRGDLGAVLLLRARVDSVAVLSLDSLALDLAGQGLRLQRPATVIVDTAARCVTIDTLDLAGAAGFVQAGGRLAPDHARLEARVGLELSEDLLQDLAPAEIWSRDGGLDVKVDGGLMLEVAADTTVFAGSLAARAQPHREHGSVGARLDFRLDDGTAAGLAADFGIESADTTVLAGAVRWPGRFNRMTRRWEHASDGMVEILVPEQAIPMALLRTVLPPDMGLRGSVMVAADARLPVAAAADSQAGQVSGSVRTRRLRVELPANSRVELDADCRLEGSPLDPRLAGTVTVTSGFLRIPELPRNLHPAEGAPVLWTLAAADSSAAADGSAAPAWGADEKLRDAPVLPDLDLDLRLPGNLRIYGYGLDVEVAGDVNVRRGHDARGLPGPALRGQVRAVRGTLRFMNRNFEISRAEVHFTGKVPADPRLDLQLETRIEGTEIRLQVTGTARTR